MTSRRIFYFTPTLDAPRGGIKQIYRHVEILCRHGHDAAVLHRRPGFRVSWFQSDAPVVDMVQFRERFRVGHDVVVVHEGLGPQILQFPPRRVIFNQNVYYGFAALDDDCAISPYLDGDAAVLTVSEHNAEMLRFAFPGVEVLRVRCGVDAARFPFRPLAAKKKQIVYPASKAVAAHTALRQILIARARAGLNALADYEWIALRGRTEAEVATILEESMICVFASVEEGFGLIPLEAILAGCIVLTHGNGPQREYAPEPFVLPEHDLLAMARAIEAHATAGPDRLLAWQAICDAARAHVIAEYSLAREEASVLAAWERILSS